MLVSPSVFSPCFATSFLSPWSHFQECAFSDFLRAPDWPAYPHWRPHIPLYGIVFYVISQTPISTDLTEIPAESGRMNYKWIIFLSRCCAMIEVVSWQKASSALHTKHCTVHGPHTPIHHLLVRGPSKSRWTSDVELVQAQMMSVCPVASYRLCCLSCPGLNLTVLFYFHLSRPLPLSALTLVFLPKAAERVELLGCPLPSFPPQMVYLSLFFFFYLSNLFTDGCASQTAELAKTKDGYLEMVEVKGRW